MQSTVRNFEGNHENFKEFASLKRTTLAWILLNLEVISAGDERSENFKAACELSQNCLDDTEKQRLLALLKQTEEFEIPELVDYFYCLIAGEK